MPPKPPTNKTEPGLGQVPGNIPRVESAEMKRVRDSFREDTGAGLSPLPPDAPPPPGKRLRDSIRREEDPDESDALERPSTPRVMERLAPPSAPTSERRASRKPLPFDDSEPGTGMRRKDRPAVTVDEVGAHAVKLARTQRDSAPKPTGSRAMVAKAPIDTRTAFILSLVDGTNTTDAIVDMSGMLDAEVKPILERLARLGLISLP